MAKRRFITDDFRTDSWVEDLDPLERYLFLYLLTNPNLSICWIYELKLKRIAFDTWIDKEMVLKIMWRFRKAKKVYYKDDIVVIINFIKNQKINSESDNLYKWIKREILELWKDKLDNLLSDKELVRTFNHLITTLQGPYKVVGILYLTLLNLTKPNLSEKQEEKQVDIETEISLFRKEIENFIIEKPKRRKLYDRDLLNSFYSYRTEPIIKWKYKWHIRKFRETTRSIEQRLDTFLRKNWCNVNELKKQYWLK